MTKHIIIIGAVALGPKVACRIKRLDPNARVTVLDKDDIISYGGCGIPYYIGGDVAELQGLCSTSAHILRDQKFFKNAKGVNVHTKTEVVSIDRKAKTVRIRHLSSGNEETLKYDKLVMATGATPVRPPLPGADLPGVSVVANTHHAKGIKDMISNGGVSRAVIIGGGAIGLEMAEALADLWGVETTLIEQKDQLVPTAFGKDMALLIKNHMEEKGVRILLSEKVTRILGDKVKGVEAVETSSATLACDLVVLAVGVRPNTRLAYESGLAVGISGGLLVDECMRTSDSDIYAGGDCVEIRHLVSGQNVHMPLGSLANRQGRVIGTNIAGSHAHFKGAVGTFCIKVFDLGVARAGLTVKQAKEAGFHPVHTVVVQSDRAHFYPTHELMYMKLIADRNTRRILGIEAIGLNGDAVKARVDSVAALLAYEACLDAVSNLEVAYAPPFASAMDIVNNAADALENIIEGRNKPIDTDAFLSDFENYKSKVLDVRSAAQAGPFIEKFGSRWLNIPQEDLACRAEEVPADEPMFLVCGSGARSFEAQLLLSQNGIKNTKNVQGGMGMIKASNPDFTKAA